jgi:5-methylcytosine-specific restriction endonuclease McrA
MGKRRSEMTEEQRAAARVQDDAYRAKRRGEMTEEQREVARVRYNAYRARWHGEMTEAQHEAARKANIRKSCRYRRTAKGKAAKKSRYAKRSADQRERANASEVARRARRYAEAPGLREAAAVYMRAYRVKNLEKIKAQERERYKDPIAIAARTARRHNRRAPDGTALTSEIVADVLRAERCHYCDEPIEIMSSVRQHPRKATVDHVLAVARGGTHARENLVAACSPCNVSKGDRPYEEFVARMKRKKTAA